MGRKRSSLPPAIVPIALSLALLAPRVRAQGSEQFEQYGPVADVSIDDITQLPEAYEGKAVRTKGRLEMLPQVGGISYALRGMYGGRLIVIPRLNVTAEWEDSARGWLGGEVQVTGTVARGTSTTTGGINVYIQIWSFFGPRPDRPVRRADAILATLEDLVTKPGKLDGKAVRVRGQFRGRNLYGDLPSASRKRSGDWVIKDELFAVWVTGKKPKGSGFEFDAGLKRDTGKWIEVIGRPTTVRGVVTIEATEVSLSKPPSPTAQAAPPAPPPPRPKKPPLVVFSMPLDRDRDVAPNTVFKIQFNKDMEESSFKGRVLLRYAGAPQPGDRELDAVKIDYDGGLRTLSIDPGDLLRPGRVVEVVLLPGIVDIDGLPLATRPGVDPGTASDVLRFRTSAGLGALP